MWLKSTDAAKILGCSPRSVRRRGIRGLIPKKIAPDDVPGNPQFLYWVDEDDVRNLELEPPLIGFNEIDKKLEKALYIPDPHIPDEDDEAVGIVLNFAKWFKPDICFVMGDVIDAALLGKYLKDPLHPFTQQDEFDLTRDFFTDVRNAVGPDCKIVWLLGNHEARWYTYLKSDATQLASLRILKDFKEVVELRDDIEIVPYNRGYNYRGRHVEHGKLVSGKAGYTAHRNMEKKMISGCNGHTHRLGQVYKTCEGGEFDWAECGNLQNLMPAYAIETTNWQHGFAVSYWTPGFKIPKMDIVSIDKNYDCLYAGKFFKP